MSWNVGLGQGNGSEGLCGKFHVDIDLREGGSRLFSLGRKAFEPKQIPVFMGQQGSQVERRG